MSENEFRGRRTNNGRWIYGQIHKCDWDIYINQDKGGIISVDPDTIGQYIGLKDKHNTSYKLYKDDIIKVTHDGSETIGVIERHDKCACYRIHIHGVPKSLGYWSFYDVIEQGCYIEKIGNIHENPELMEV